MSLFGDISNFAGNIFGAGDPYKDYAKELQKYISQGMDKQKPFYDMGTGAIPKYQNWTDNMSDPAKFMNDLQDKYKQSDYYNFLNQQGQNEIRNKASAQGLVGSTPYEQAGVDYAQMTAQKGLDNWLKNVLGINTQYGDALNTQMGYGQHSADVISQLLTNLGIGKAGSKFGQDQSNQNFLGNALSSILAFL